MTFSQQILYGDALVAQQQWSQAEAHWRKLLGLVQSPQQQQYLQLKLAAVLVNSDQIEAIFTADSPIKNLRYRSLILKTKAQKALLQQQVFLVLMMRKKPLLCTRYYCGILCLVIIRVMSRINS